MRRSSFAVLCAPLALLPILAACGGDPVGPRDPEDLTYAPSLGVDLSQMTRTSAGLYYQVLEQGQGSDVAAEGDEVSVEYTGWLHTGTQFDTGTLPPFTLGGDGPSDQVIDGFFLGVLGMRLGETRLLVIPYQLGYGDQRAGPIPKYSTLVFRITLESLVKAE